MAQQTGKQRAIRIPLDYFKNPDRMQRWKMRLALLAFAVSLGWLGVNLASGDSRNYDYARGPVANVHVTWEDNCNACHVSFVPIADRNWIDKQGWFHKFAGGQPRDVANAKCETCHAGPAHHKGQTPDLSCASCHRDHQGREFNLTRVADNDCVQCHGNLPVHTAADAPKPAGGPYANVTAFTTNHPDFRSIKKDPGKLRFNHDLHMTAGQVLTPDAKQKWTLGNVDPAYRERYRAQQPLGHARDDAAPVQLDCASCHQLSGADFGIDKKPAGVRYLPERTSGAYMLPIVYENQCAGCHPLNFEPNAKAQAGAKVPHGLQPPEVRDFLMGAYAERNLQAKKFVPRRPVPGNDVTQEEKQALSDVEKSIDAAQRYLFQSEMKVFPDKTTCGECHHYSDDNKIPGSILAPNVPQVWFQHGSFNHARHRGMDCRVCHPNAYAKNADGQPNPNASKVATDVLVPGIDNCRQCHAPHYRSGPKGATLGGARFDCAECHTYHHRNTPSDWTQGIGAASRNPKQPLDLNQFLKGSK